MKIDKKASKRLGVTVMVDENVKKPKEEVVTEAVNEESPKKKEKKAKEFLRDEE